MNDCIFCKINKGEIPSHNLYEDDLVRVFLTINPVTRGHLLVVPKEHYENIFDASEEVLARINIICKKFALILKEKLKADAINIVNSSGEVAGQSVFHLHYHVVPRYNNDNLEIFPHEKKGERGGGEEKEGDVNNFQDKSKLDFEGILGEIIS